MSWIKKLLSRLHEKIVREKAPPEYIARGWAIGVFMGFSIPFGLQLFVSIPVSFVLKGSKVGATLGTFVTNHLTIFVIYPVQCWVGNRLLGGDLSYDAVNYALREVVAEKSFESVISLGGNLFEAFFAGGILFAAVSTPLTYWFVLRAVKRYRALTAAQAARKA